MAERPAVRVKEVRVGLVLKDGAPALAVSTVLVPPWAVTRSGEVPLP